MNYDKPLNPIIIQHPFVHDATSAMDEPALYPLHDVLATANEIHDNIAGDLQCVLRPRRHGHWRFQAERVGFSSGAIPSDNEEGAP